RALAGAGVPGDEKHFARLHFETDLRQRDMPPGALLADVVEAQARHAAILALRPRSVLRAGRAGDQRLEAAADPGQQRRRRGRGRFRRLRAGGRLLALARGARLLRGTRVALLACGLRLAIRLHVRLATLDALAAAAAAALARGTLAFGSRGRGRRGGRFGPGRRGRRARLAGGTLGRGRLAPARARAALAALAAFAARAATATTAATALLLGRALLARLAEDLAHALAVLVGRALARCARQGHQQFRGDRLDRDLLLDVGLDVRQRHRVALAGEADRVAFLAQPRGAADAVHVVLGVERQVVVVDVLDAVDVQAARGHVGGDEDFQLALLEAVEQALALLLRHVAGEHADPVAGTLQRPRHALDEHLGVDEDHRARAFAARQQAQQQRQLFFVGREIDALAHAVGGDVVGFHHQLLRLVHEIGRAHV